jgi:hypothetical protein
MVPFWSCLHSCLPELGITLISIKMGMSDP